MTATPQLIAACHVNNSVANATARQTRLDNTRQGLEGGDRWPEMHLASTTEKA